MTEKQYTIIGACSFVFGLLLCSYLNGWLIVRFPSYLNDIDQFYATTVISKKKVTLFVWHHDQWHKETTELLWSRDHTKNIESLVNAWLTLLEDEGLLTAQITLQSVLLASHDTHAYLSFDHTFLPQNNATRVKWRYVESLLKTVRENDIPISHVYLLVQHQPMEDYHLDFSNPWSIAGFMSE